MRDLDNQALAGQHMSIRSTSSVPTSPRSYHATRIVNSTAMPPPKFALSQPGSAHKEAGGSTRSPTTAPLEESLPGYQSSPGQPLPQDRYDPERPGLVFQTPMSSPTMSRFSSPSSFMSNVVSPTSTRTIEYQRLPDQDSPPCSPKTLRPKWPLLPTQNNFSPYYMKEFTTTETFPIDTIDTIDPAVLNKDAFGTLNSGFDLNASILSAPSSIGNSVPMPMSSGSARAILEPLLEAAFPSSPPAPHDSKRTSANLEPPQPSLLSSPISRNPSPSLSLSPSISLMPPSSPRPHHADLPMPTLNFAGMPTLNPSLSGPRHRAARPLRSSIAKLRRMNSDAEKNGKDKAGRGERRYLRLGREESIPLPGEESFLDELDDAEEGISGINEEKGRLLVGNLLDWEEEATVIDFDEDKGKTQQTDTVPVVEAERELEDELRKSRSLAPTSSPHTDFDRSSSIWEDGEKFWHSTPPHPPNSPNKPRDNFVSLSTSPPQHDMKQPPTTLCTLPNQS